MCRRERKYFIFNAAKVRVFFHQEKLSLLLLIFLEIWKYHLQLGTLGSAHFPRFPCLVSFVSQPEKLNANESSPIDWKNRKSRKLSQDLAFVIQPQRVFSLEKCNICLLHLWVSAESEHFYCLTVGRKKLFRQKVPPGSPRADSLPG